MRSNISIIGGKHYGRKKLLDKDNIDVLMAVKFGKRQHNQDILDGKLYLDTVEYFRNLEEGKLQNRGTADKTDSCYVLQNGRLDVLNETDEKPLISVEFKVSRLKRVATNYVSVYT